MPVEEKPKKAHRLKQRFEVIKKLGQGTYGKVQLAVNKETGQQVAIKTIKKSKIESEQDLVRIRREIQIMSSIQHPHIVHIFEVFENKNKIVLVMQYANGGELYEYVSERKVLTDAEARRLFRQIATAIYYCHKNKICHRDLKLENILLDEKGNAKIADFGLSNVFDQKHHLSTFCGSPLYASPEIVKGTPYYGPEVDCWSMGVLLYTLVYGAMPFDGSNFKRLVKQISEANYFEPTHKSDASALIRRLLTPSPSKRATIDDICTDVWVNRGFEHSLLQVAEDLSNLTPVRIDALLALAPISPAADSEKRAFKIPESNSDATIQKQRNGHDDITKGILSDIVVNGTDLTPAIDNEAEMSPITPDAFANASFKIPESNSEMVITQNGHQEVPEPTPVTHVTTKNIEMSSSNVNDVDMTSPTPDASMTASMASMTSMSATPGDLTSVMSTTVTASFSDDKCAASQPMSTSPSSADQPLAIFSDLTSPSLIQTLSTTSSQAMEIKPSESLSNANKHEVNDKQETTCVELQLEPSLSAAKQESFSNGMQVEGSSSQISSVELLLEPEPSLQVNDVNKTELQIEPTAAKESQQLEPQQMQTTESNSQISSQNLPNNSQTNLTNSQTKLDTQFNSQTKTQSTDSVTKPISPQKSQTSTNQAETPKSQPQTPVSTPGTPTSPGDSKKLLASLRIQSAIKKKTVRQNSSQEKVEPRKQSPTKSRLERKSESQTSVSSGSQTSVRRQSISRTDSGLKTSPVRKQSPTKKSTADIKSKPESKPKEIKQISQQKTDISRRQSAKPEATKQEADKNQQQLMSLRNNFKRRKSSPGFLSTMTFWSKMDVNEVRKGRKDSASAIPKVTRANSAKEEPVEEVPEVKEEAAKESKEFKEDSGKLDDNEMRCELPVSVAVKSDIKLEPQEEKENIRLESSIDSSKKELVKQELIIEPPRRVPSPDPTMVSAMQSSAVAVSSTKSSSSNIIQSIRNDIESIRGNIESMRSDISKSRSNVTKSISSTSSTSETDSLTKSGSITSSVTKASQESQKAEFSVKISMSKKEMTAVPSRSEFKSLSTGHQQSSVRSLLSSNFEEFKSPRLVSDFTFQIPSLRDPLQNTESTSTVSSTATSTLAESPSLTSSACTTPEIRSEMKPMPIVRSYKKFTFTKDGQCITEMGQTYESPELGGSSRPEKKSNMTRFLNEEIQLASTLLPRGSLFSRLASTSADLDDDDLMPSLSTTSSQKGSLFSRLTSLNSAASDSTSSFYKSDLKSDGASSHFKNDSPLNSSGLFKSDSNSSTDSTDIFDDIFDEHWSGDNAFTSINRLRSLFNDILGDSNIGSGSSLLGRMSRQKERRPSTRARAESLCRGTKSVESPSPIVTSPDTESVQERILRKSFYSRFNDSTLPRSAGRNLLRRRSSIVDSYDSDRLFGGFNTFSSFGSFGTGNKLDLGSKLDSDDLVDRSPLGALNTNFTKSSSIARSNIGSNLSGNLGSNGNGSLNGNSSFESSFGRNSSYRRTISFSSSGSGTTTPSTTNVTSSFFLPPSVSRTSSLLARKRIELDELNREN